MKKAFLIAFVGLIFNNCFSQNVNSKYFIGGSVSYIHDNLTNNRLLSNYLPYDKNNSDVFGFFGEFGINLNSKSAIGFDLGYILNRSEYEKPASGTQGSDYLKSSASGIIFSPKYRITVSVRGNAYLISGAKSGSFGEKLYEWEREDFQKFKHSTAVEILRHDADRLCQDKQYPDTYFALLVI